MAIVLVDMNLLLDQETFAADGTVKTGLVVNGGWRFEARSGECLSKGYRGEIYNRWPVPPQGVRFVRVTAGIPLSDYNEVIHWAKERDAAAVTS